MFTYGPAIHHMGIMGMSWYIILDKNIDQQPMDTNGMFFWVFLCSSNTYGDTT